MAEEVEMTPVDGAEPPKANPIPGMAAPVASTLKLNPVHKPEAGGASALKPGLKLPAKPGATISALRPGLKLPTQTALKPGLKLPAKPVIRKPGATIAAMPIPKPVAPVAPAPVAAAPVAAPAAPAPAAAPAAPAVAAAPKPMEALKAATQKLKGITQEIPQQAILHKTGIIAESVATEVQKEAAKHKTARISLSDAMGVAPVKEDAAPMKTIRIRRPIDIASAPATAPAAAPAAAAEAPAAPTMTQRKTLKISRPGTGAVRPGGKFGANRPAAPEAAPAEAGAAAEVSDIPDIPNMPAAPLPMPAPVAEGSSGLFTLSALIQLAACVAIGALAWFLYQNTQTSYF